MKSNTNINTAEPRQAENHAADSHDLAFGKMNYILTAIGMAVVILGFILMSGSSSNTEAYNPDIFSPLRIKVAPVVCLVGFLTIVVAIIYPKSHRNS